MSADNYVLIRRVGDRFAVTDESASEQLYAEEHPIGALWHPTPVDSPRVRWHDTIEEARGDAHSVYAEYGITEDIEGDHAGDTLAARLARTAGSLEGTYLEHMRTNDHAAGTATLHLGDVTVTVASPAGDWERVCEYTSWLSATTPDGLAGLDPTP